MCLCIYIYTHTHTLVRTHIHIHVYKSRSKSLWLGNRVNAKSFFFSYEFSFCFVFCRFFGFLPVCCHGRARDNINSFPLFIFFLPIMYMMSSRYHCTTVNCHQTTYSITIHRQDFGGFHYTWEVVFSSQDGKKGCVMQILFSSKLVTKHYLS